MVFFSSFEKCFCTCFRQKQLGFFLSASNLVGFFCIHFGPFLGCRMTLRVSASTYFLHDKCCHILLLFPFQFFYLVTETYKMGTLKEMQRWAYEIFSSYLVEDAPLRVPNLENSTIEEIDRWVKGWAFKEMAKCQNHRTRRERASKICCWLKPTMVGKEGLSSSQTLSFRGGNFALPDFASEWCENTFRFTEIRNINGGTKIQYWVHN